MNQTLKVGYMVKMYPRLSETFIVNEILEMERRGIDVTIFSLMKPDEGRFHPQVSGVKAPVFYLDSPGIKEGWPMLIKYWPTLAPFKDRLWDTFTELLIRGDSRLIKLFFSAASASAIALDLGLDHLHAHFASTPSSVAYFASRITGLGFSCTAHAKDIFRNTIDGAFLEEKIQATRFLATVTQFNQRHILSGFPGVPSDKVKVVYNGIDLDLFDFAPYGPRELGLILAVGRLVPKKGFADLIIACSILKGRGVPFRCVIIGDGEQRGMLESMRCEFDLSESLILAGPKTQTGVREYLRCASVFVLPCTLDPDGNQDALPTVLLEALGAGCPVVSTSISGVPEIVDAGVDGLLAPPGDPEAIANSIEYILSAPDHAAEFARRGRQKAEQRFNLKNNVGVLEELFRQAVSGSVTQPEYAVASPEGGNTREDTVPVI
jgi:colanic acid/amylovoran biosynthesis glycosyltransferase